MLSKYNIFLLILLFHFIKAEDIKYLKHIFSDATCTHLLYKELISNCNFFGRVTHNLTHLNWYDDFDSQSYCSNMDKITNSEPLNECIQKEGSYIKLQLYINDDTQIYAYNTGYCEYGYYPNSKCDPQFSIKIITQNNTCFKKQDSIYYTMVSCGKENTVDIYKEFICEDDQCKKCKRVLFSNNGDCSQARNKYFLKTNTIQIFNSEKNYYENVNITGKNIEKVEFYDSRTLTEKMQGNVITIIVLVIGIPSTIVIVYSFLSYYFKKDIYYSSVSLLCDDEQTLYCSRKGLNYIIKSFCCNNNSITRRDFIKINSKKYNDLSSFYIYTNKYGTKTLLYKAHEYIIYDGEITSIKKKNVYYIVSNDDYKKGKEIIIRDEKSVKKVKSYDVDKQNYLL